MFKELFTESKIEYKVYFEDKTLWVAYGQGSGTTAYNLDIKKFLSDDKSDKEHYDGIVANIVKFANSTKPMKETGKTKLFEIPVYGKSEYGKTLDVWGGDIKPNKKYYMIVTEEKNTIVNIFAKKAEALSWIKSIT